MVKVIDGSTGRYSPSTPGGYGRNAAANACQHLEEIKTREDLQVEVTHRYTPEGSVRPDGTVDADVFYPNLLAFEETAIKEFDADGNGSLNREEYMEKNYFESRKSVGASLPNFLGERVKERLIRIALKQFEERFATFDILDRNRDGELDLVENAANTLFMDNASNRMADKMISLTDGDEQVQQAAMQLKRQYPSEFDGQITPLERAAALVKGIMKAPELMGQILDDIIQEHDLYKRQDAFALSQVQ